MCQAVLLISFPQCGNSGIQAHAIPWLCHIGVLHFSYEDEEERKREAEKERGTRDEEKEWGE